MDPHEKASDATLLERTAREPLAFGTFYRRYERPVLGYLRSRVRDPELVADLAAEVFAAALEGAARFDPARSHAQTAAPWLFAIAHHVVSGSLRRGRVDTAARQRMGMRTPLVMTDEGFERVEEISSADGAASALLAVLPEEQRAAVVARVLDERDYAEIAGELRCSELVVRKRVSRGLATMRSELEETS